MATRLHAIGEDTKVAHNLVTIHFFSHWYKWHQFNNGIDYTNYTSGHNGMWLT